MRVFHLLWIEPTLLLVRLRPLRFRKNKQQQQSSLKTQGFSLLWKPPVLSHLKTVRLFLQPDVTAEELVVRYALRLGATNKYPDGDTIYPDPVSLMIFGIKHTIDRPHLTETSPFLNRENPKKRRMSPSTGKL